LTRPRRRGEAGLVLEEPGSWAVVLGFALDRAPGTARSVVDCEEKRKRVSMARTKGGKEKGESKDAL